MVPYGDFYDLLTIKCVVQGVMEPENAVCSWLQFDETCGATETSILMEAASIITSVTQWTDHEYFTWNPAGRESVKVPNYIQAIQGHLIRSLSW